MISLLLAAVLEAGEQGTREAPAVDASAAVALAETTPLLALNLNNYKHPANPILSGGERGQWDAAGIERVVVIRVGRDDWRMWYACTGPRHSIGLATSKDGVRWVKHAGNPVLEPTEPWEESYLSPSSVVQVDGTFYLYYWGPGHVYRDPTTGKLPQPKRKYIALATSEDGIHWARRGALDGRKGAVLGPDPPAINEHEAAGGSGVDAAKVFYLPEERARPWRMIYTAFGRHGQWNGLAESSDGIDWQKTVAPVAHHAGLYNRASGNHHDSGQTIRCPVRVGSFWAGLSYELDSGDSAPCVGLGLDRWITIGRRALYRNQDYESGVLHPWCIEADEEWYYVYYSTGRRSLGLSRAPKRSMGQPMLLWERQAIGPAGAMSRAIEPDRRPLQLHLVSDRDGELRPLAWNPAGGDWMELAGSPVQAGELFSLPPLPSHARLRLKFTPREGPAVVSAWAVPR